MNIFTDSETIAQHLAKYAMNYQPQLLDNYGYEYRVLGGKYCVDTDQIFIEIDSHYMREYDWSKSFIGSKNSITPTKIIFNGPATIVFWDDGTKTVVKCMDCDEFDCEKGIALCYMKKMLGNDSSFHHIFKKFITKDSYERIDLTLGEETKSKLVDYSQRSNNKTFDILERIRRNAKHK